MIPDIKIADFNYDLPDERIAKYPLEQRDASKLLIYKDGEVRENIFRNLSSELPENSLMVFNDTKVVPARLHFHRSSGAHIEVFCLQPVDPCEYNVSFSSTTECIWKCVIGNSKRWKGDVLECDLPGTTLRAELVSLDGPVGNVKFSWDGGANFSQILEQCGQVPIPPYLNRDTEAIDVERYQTTYAHIKGSVAAPTAGLHFTEETLKDIAAKSIDIENVCLHVGAGTFLPVKSADVASHPMHREPFVVSRSLIVKLIENSGKIIAVGTTSVRTLESLYYIGVKCIESGQISDVAQWEPYEREYTYSTRESLEAIIEYLDRNGLDNLMVGTRIIIVPGFRFRLVDVMVTNFHQPQSTLLLLISAFVSGDWHRIYDYALGNGFRFLSYGDSSLLFKRQ